MDLETIKLNRFIYRNQATPVSENPVYMSANQNSLREVQFNKGTTPGKKEAKEVITGTIITACLIKSSDQDDRIEIGQSLEKAIVESNTPFNTGLTGAVDYLAAYRDGKITVLITGQGGIYLNYVQQQQKWLNNRSGIIRQSGSLPLWVVSIAGTGEYLVTHNIGHINYSVMVTPYSDIGWLGGMCGLVSEQTANSFKIEMVEPFTGSHEDQDWNCVVEINPA